MRSASAPEVRARKTTFVVLVLCVAAMLLGADAAWAATSSSTPDSSTTTSSTPTTEGTTEPPPLKIIVAADPSTVPPGGTFNARGSCPSPGGYPLVLRLVAPTGKDISNNSYGIFLTDFDIVVHVPSNAAPGRYTLVADCLELRTDIYANGSTIVTIARTATPPPTTPPSVTPTTSGSQLPHTD